MSTVIKVENVSKQYRLGLIGSGTLREDLEGWWYRLRGKDDPTLGLSEVNDRSSVGTSNYVWALQNINFEVQQGEVLGIIGKNGAGKSTLLKLLSRVTAPTTGSIKAKGRIASLLEVGTGFHPELTGKENIFLNGAIMGMKKAEIKRKLEEIVDFAGVERYLETPVKRYSSGMYVRLAFAVAAHLEPEILIVDEVLAVGDAEFQKKALGKMKEVSGGSGRTVLFVSHNMASVQNLCSRAVLLKNGRVSYVGNVNDSINNYLSLGTKQNIDFSDDISRKGDGPLKFTRGEFECIGGVGSTIETFKDLKIIVSYNLNRNVNIHSFQIDIGINNHMGVRVAWMSTSNTPNSFNLDSGQIQFIVKNLPLAPGDYTCNIYCKINDFVSDWLSDVMPFSVAEMDYYNSGKLVPKGQGDILLNYSIV